MKKIAQILIATAAMTMASSAFAANGCTGGGGGDATISSGGFIVNNFTLKCSNNVFLNYDATTDTTVVSVCAGSAKGSRKYGGSSAGGAVKESGTATAPAAQGDVAVDINGCSA